MRETAIMPSIKVNRPISNLKKSVVPKKNNTAEICGSANTVTK